MLRIPIGGNSGIPQEERFLFWGHIYKFVYGFDAYFRVLHFPSMFTLFENQKFSAIMYRLGLVKIVTRHQAAICIIFIRMLWTDKLRKYDHSFRNRTSFVTRLLTR